MTFYIRQMTMKNAKCETKIIQKYLDQGISSDY